MGPRAAEAHVSPKVSPTMNTAVGSGQSLSWKEIASVTSREPEGSSLSSCRNSSLLFL